MNPHVQTPASSGGGAPIQRRATGTGKRGRRPAVPGDMRSTRTRWRVARFAAGLGAAVIAAMLLPGLALGAAPAIEFTWAPQVPAAGEAVVLTAADASPPIVSWLWDLDGDHVPDAAGRSATVTFATPGPHVVRVDVIAVNGRSATAEHTVMVGEPVAKPAPATIPPTSIPPAAITPAAITPGAITPGAATAPAPVLPAPAARLMTPFPIVRIQGGLVPGGVIVTRLTVQAPGGARVRAVCHGPGCPQQPLIRRARSARLPVRLRPLERRLGSGAVLEVFVTKSAAVGKYTRFVIHRGAAPSRRDLCVPPAGQRPAHCPGD